MTTSSWALARAITVAVIATVAPAPGARAALDCYKLLGVGRQADAKELKRAYRREALRWHPDKNQAPEAEEKFREVAHCYEILSGASDAGRGSGPRGGGFGGVDIFDSRRAFRTFEDLFGDVHQQWRPGMTVKGTFVSGGRRVRITIHPDGTTEEDEGVAGEQTKYSSVYRSDGTTVQMHFEGDPREMVAEWLKNELQKSGLPGMLLTALAPLITFVLFVLCSPWLCCGLCCYCCCFRRKAHAE